MPAVEVGRSFAELTAVFALFFRLPPRTSAVSPALHLSSKHAPDDIVSPQGLVACSTSWGSSLGVLSENLHTSAGTGVFQGAGATGTFTQDSTFPPPIGQFTQIKMNKNSTCTCKIATQQNRLTSYIGVCVYLCVHIFLFVCVSLST